MKYDFNLPYDEVANLIDQWVFDERAREMLKWHLLDGWGLEKIAEKANVDTATVKRNLKKSKERFFKHVEFKLEFEKY